MSIEPKRIEPKKVVDTTLTLLTYGYPDMVRENAINIILKKWGIRYYPVAGCVVTEELIDSVKIHNDSISKIIENKYGKNWERQFENQIAAEFEKQKIIADILDKVDFIKKKNGQLRKERNRLQYDMTPIDNTTDYNVSIEGWCTIDNKETWVSYYRMTVNYKTKKYSLKEDNIVTRE